MNSKDGLSDRKYWVDILEKISFPVLNALADQKLKALMPIECISSQKDRREKFAHLEAFARCLAGIAPWLENKALSEDEEQKRGKAAQLARHAIHFAAAPDSADFMNFCDNGQPLVDSAFLALALLRAPSQLWEKLPDHTKDNVITALKKTRSIKPLYNNWILFSAAIEIFFFTAGIKYDIVRIEYALRQHEQWYQGGGFYSNGPHFIFDYYNSFVIHPVLMELIERAAIIDKDFKKFNALIIDRAVEHALLIEKFISPEGTFPPVGPSLTYRMGVFHCLAKVILSQYLPNRSDYPKMRCALTKTMQRMMEAPDVFDENGWLTVGLVGHQPDKIESHIDTGSLYQCTAGLLPLGLSPENLFWSGEPEKWTSQIFWP
jgi:hypothetical protein